MSWRASCNLVCNKLWGVKWQVKSAPPAPSAVVAFLCLARLSVNTVTFMRTHSFFEFVLTKHTQAAVYDLQNSI